MKRTLKRVLIIFAAVIFLGFGVNSLVRVGHSTTRSIGIIEQLLFGRPIEEAVAPPWSEDYKRWDSASKASGAVADLLQQFGTEALTTRKDLSEERSRAEHLSKTAFKNANAISRSYLAESNAELPDAYFHYFVPAIDAWQRGFADEDVAKVQEGVSAYNSFLKWMKSRDRSEFKPMR